uniref:SMP-LTD domain-containing protein n=1 Tax=Trichobilharzia regenti TaxID=157069 RepID=A0AA85KDU4_TRIRE|nr:unnamed protein product [Trichobilharzia regenti]
MRRSVSPNSKKPLKLPGLSPRSSSTKHDWDSVGTIKFFTDKDDDISGLDEAMRNISMGSRQPNETNGKDPTAYTTYSDELKQQSKSGVEIAIEATSISESVSLVDPIDSNETDKTVHCDEDESVGVFSFSSDSLMSSSTPPNTTGISKSGDRNAPFYTHDSNDISALKSTGRHTSSSLKFTTDDNPLGDDSDLHSLSEVLPSSSTDFKIHSTTVVNIPIVNQSVGSSVLLSESDKITDSSVMGNQLDSHDIRKLSTNSTVEQVKKVSDASQSSSVVRVKSDTFPSTSSTPTTTNTCQVPSKITESIHLPATIPKSIPSNPPNSSSLGNTEVKQRHIIAASSSEPTNAGINPKHSPLGTTKSKLQILPRRHKFSSWILYTSCALGLFSTYWLFSGFVWGLIIGCLLTYTCISLRNYLYTSTECTNQTLCPISGLPLNQLCCSLHYRQEQEGYYQASQWWPIYSPAMPNISSLLSNTNTATGNKSIQLRNLPNFTVPNMLEEDVNKSTSSGPLGNSLGFKYDKSGRPIYKGWLNEITNYDPETHHIGRTFSVFITLDGTQLRLQRPEHNITRRSLWNDEIPSTTTMRFKQQRIYDLSDSSITLLPYGLVGKRLWSRKYPICITVPFQNKSKRKTERLNSLPSSTSFPNILLSTAGGNSTTNEVSDLLVDTSVPSTTGDMEFPDDTSVSAFPTPDKKSVKTLYLFGRTCREKETWYRRLKAASLGVPLIWTPQLAVQNYLLASDNNNTNISLPDCLNTVTASTTASGVAINNEVLSDDESRLDANTTSNPVTTSWDSTTNTSATATTATTSSLSNTNSVGSSSSVNLSSYGAAMPGSREPVYVSYIRYMAKFMPAGWLVRSAQALKLNVNQINCDTNMIWLNALIGRLLWDFLREAYWLERIRNKIQAKLKKIHLPNFINELTVVDIDLGSEIPVLRRVGCPYLDAHGLWIEIDIGYAGGFSFALETSVNLMRWNQKLREEKDNNNSTDNFTQNSPSSNESIQRMNSRSTTKMAAFVSDEEDSADSTTDSELDESAMNQNSSPTNSLRSGRNLPSVGLNTSVLKSGDSERNNLDESAVNLQPALPSRRRIIRIVDRITKSSYFQKAVDTKLVQRGMERLSNTPIVLQVEIQMLSGQLLVNIPPPPSDRLWYGFRPTPTLRIKTRPRVGEKVVTMSRILEWIEKKIILEFQHLVVLPNMDDLKIGLLLSDATSSSTPLSSSSSS